MTQDAKRSHPKVKVCGLGRYEDAAVALDHGAWALGFIFHPPSKRNVALDEVRDIVQRLPSSALTVGVFVNVPLADIVGTVRATGLRGVQLHGDESPAFVEEVRVATGVDCIIKALRVGSDFDPAVVDDFSSYTVLLDTYHDKLAGGTGESFDWSQARKVGERTPVLVAGGLHPGNVAEALAIARPDGVDVSGGLESAPGVKDHAQIRRFFEAVRGAT